MNCRNCGAENEPGARFCAECGAPLEDLRGATQPLDDDNDQTIVSARPDLVEEEAKTVSVTQDEVAEAAVDAEPTAPSGFELESPPPPPESSGPPEADGVDGSDWLNQRNIIIAVVVLLLLCCCCFFLAIGGMAGSGALEDVLNELGMLSPYLNFV